MHHVNSNNNPATLWLLACLCPQIGKHTKMEELKAVQQYLSTCNRRVEVVSVAWLELCHREQRLVPVDSRCRLQISSLMGGATAAQGALGAGPAGLRSVSSTGAAGGGGGVFANTASRGGFPDAEKQQDSVAWVPEYWHEQPADPLKLFDGCYFTLAAVQSHQAEHEKALGHIRCVGLVGWGMRLSVGVASCCLHQVALR